MQPTRLSTLQHDFHERLDNCKRVLSFYGPIKPQGLHTGVLQSTYCKVSLGEVSAFLLRAGYEVAPEMLTARSAETALDSEPLRPASAPTTATPAPLVTKGADERESWKQDARKRAMEIIRRNKEKDLYPSQQHIADEIARAFRSAGVMGAGGKPLTGAYIKRHALKGISSAEDKKLDTSMRQSKQGNRS